MFKTDIKLSAACDKAVIMSARTGKCYIVSLDGKGGYVVEQKISPFFGWAVVYVTL